MGNKVTSVVSTVASGAAAAVAYVVTAPLVLTASVAAAVVSSGFVVVNSFKDETKEKFLKAGWKKVYYLKETSGKARVCGAILSAGLAELFGTHSNVYRSEICDAGGNFLGNTILQAVKKIRKQGENYLEKGDNERAIKCFRAADDNCPNELTEEKLAFRENINTARSEIQYKKGLEFVKDGDFSVALESFKTAIALCTNDNRKRLFLKDLNNAEAEKIYQEGQQILTGGCRRHYEIFKEHCDQALQKCSKDYFDRKKIENSRNSTTAIIEKIKNQEKAEELFKKAETLWLDACAAEKQNNNEAAEKFDQVHAKFQEILRTVNDNVHYRKLATICHNKIQGNDRYNRGVCFLQQGNDAFKRRQYGNARMKYCSAYDLCLKAEENFQQIQSIQPEDEFQGWLNHVVRLKESLSKIIESSTLHIPSEKRHGVHNLIAEIQHENIQITTVRNG